MSPAHKSPTGSGPRRDVEEISLRIFLEQRPRVLYEQLAARPHAPPDDVVQHDPVDQHAQGRDPVGLVAVDVVHHRPGLKPTR
jgi:hypothetical protein